MAIKRTTKGWQADFRLGGREGRRIRKTFPSFALAKKYQARLLGESIGKRYFPDSHQSNISFSEFVTEYINKHVYKLAWGKFVIYQLNVLRQQFGPVPLAEIGMEDIEEWLRDFSVGKKQATVNNYVALLKTLFKKAVQWKRIKASPAMFLEKPDPKNERYRYARPEELTKIWETASERFTPFLMALLNSGMRWGRVQQLVWERDINLEDRLAFVGNRKGRDYFVPINKTWHESLKALPHREGSVYRLSRAEIRGEWERTCQKAKIDHHDLHLHDLRHTFGTYLSALEKDSRLVQEAMGHSDPKMTARYAHVMNERLREAFERVQFQPKSGVHNVSTQGLKQAKSGLRGLKVSVDGHVAEWQTHRT